MKRGIVLAALAMVLALSGCGNMTDTQKLLRAPQGTGETGAIQQALNSYLGESVQLKFPTTGDYLSPFVFGDWDGDGTQDAAVLYTSQATGQNVNLALLAKDDQDQWQVIDWEEGLASEVHSVTVAGLKGTQDSQILVGYGSPQTGLYLAVYAQGSQGAENLLQQTYSQLLLADLSGSGAQDLILVLPENEDGNIDLQVLTNSDGSFHVSQQLTVGQGAFDGCAELTPGVDRRGTPYLVVDGYLGNSGSSLGSVILMYDSQEGRLVHYRVEGMEDLPAGTQRYSSILTSRDLEDNGIVCIPQQVAWDIDPDLEHRTAVLEWMDFTNPEDPLVSFGIWDMEYNFYLPLPESLKETACLRPSDMGWMVCDKETGETYLYVRVAYPSESRGDYTRIGYIGSQQIQVKIGTTYPGLDIYNVSEGTVIL